MTKRGPFRYFKTSPEIIRLAVMLYVRYPLSLRNVEDLLHERGIDVSHETVRFWWNRFGPMFAAEIRRKQVERMRSGPVPVLFRFFESNTRLQGDRIWQRHTATSSSGMQFASHKQAA
jgi:transposase-like protein